MLGELKMKKILCLIFIIVSALHDVNAHLQKRGLVFPPTSPTRHQLISGIGIPLELEDEAITLGIVLKAQYFLVSTQLTLPSESTKVLCLPQPETANQLKFNFFPDIWAPYTKDFLWDIDSKPFPNGRRRRAILNDPLTGQHYESYEGIVEQIGDVPLNDTNRDSDAALWEDGDDEFDDQFEEDLLDKQDLSRQQQRQQDDEAEKSDDFDLSSSRWVAYDALSSMLQRYSHETFSIGTFILIKSHLARASTDGCVCCVESARQLTFNLAGI